MVPGDPFLDAGMGSAGGELELERRGAAGSAGAGAEGEAAAAEEGERLAREALRAADRLLAERAGLAAALRAGQLQLARARYSMGAQRVGPWQVPEEVEAACAVAGRPGAGCLELRRRGGARDPLDWFGGLVSPHLRAAQQDFQKALPLVLRVSGSQRDLQRKVARYERFRKEGAQLRRDLAEVTARQGALDLAAEG